VALVGQCCCSSSGAPEVRHEVADRETRAHFGDSSVEISGATTAMPRMYEFVVVLALLSSSVTGNTELTLICNGKLKVGDSEAEPLTHMSIGVNLTSKTVSGFDVVGNIYKSDDTYIAFKGQSAIGKTDNVLLLEGTIDRITNAVSAITTFVSKSNTTKQVISELHLACVTY
jgi:hypothetical protein